MDVGVQAREDTEKQLNALIQWVETLERTHIRPTFPEYSGDP
ncbi:hypothetical protein [Actinomadura opuntiae]|nr:hypothetical protein [Actinomadura sp. OS1-43]MDL4815033.1 hypothetical protein [Actinomadura sp. OS1-43]